MPRSRDLPGLADADTIRTRKEEEEKKTASDGKRVRLHFTSGRVSLQEGCPFDGVIFFFSLFGFSFTRIANPSSSTTASDGEEKEN